MSGKVGVKELSDVIDFMDVLGVKAVMALKDGASLDDLKLILDPILWAKGKAAVDGLTGIPEEIKDLSLDEAGELSLKMFQVVKHIAEALKK